MGRVIPRDVFLWRVSHSGYSISNVSFFALKREVDTGKCLTITKEYANVVGEREGRTANLQSLITYIRNQKSLQSEAEFFVSFTTLGVIVIPDYNSLSNLNTLRGLRGAYPRVGVLGNPLAWYSLSMRKLCLESYPLEK